ncbi:MAG: tetratricopeptide repeat protein [Hormoscilla sp.]
MDGKQGIEDYFNFIRTLASCSNSQEQAEILQANPDLVFDDDELLMATLFAPHLANINAEQLQNLAVEPPEIAFWYELSNRADEFADRGRYDEAETYAQQALDTVRQLSGDNQNFFLATSKNQLALIYRYQGRFPEAEQLYLDALQIAKKMFGNEDTQVAGILNNLAVVYRHQGRFAEAKTLCEEALRMSIRLLGPAHSDVARSLNNLAIICEYQGEFDEAEQLYREALKMSKRFLGEEHPFVAQCLNNIAVLYMKQSRFPEAEEKHLEALEMRKRIFGQEHPHVAQSLHNLASLYEDIGRLFEAESKYLEALQIEKRMLGQDHPDVAATLNNLALIYQAQKRFTEALDKHMEALKIVIAKFGKEHINVASSLNNLALSYQKQGLFPVAEQLHMQCLHMRKRLLGEEHPDVVNSLNNLASIWELQERLTEADTLYQEVLEMRKRLLGEEHLDVANTMNNRAILYEKQERFAQAQPLHQEALEMRKRLLGEDHPYVAASLNNLAALLATTNRPFEAMAKMTEATEIDDRILRRTFAFSSEKDRLTYLQSIRHRFEMFLSLVLNYFQDSSEVVQTLLDLVLRRKALSASALAAQNQALYSGRYPHLTAEFKQLRRLSSEIVHLSFAIPEAGELSRIKETLQQKQIEYDNLQRQLAQQVPEIKLQEQPTDRRAVTFELPEGSTLVEFVCTRIFDSAAPRGKEWKPSRYLAFILPAQQPDAVRLIDLGEAKEIDRLIRVFREALSQQRDSLLGNRLEMWDTDPEPECLILAYNLPAEAIQLRKALFGKITPYLKNSKHLILAPDGALNILPFQLLPLAGERMLMDEYSISYLSVGRDILRATIETTRPASFPVVIADPDFDLKLVGSFAPSQTQPTSLAGTIFHRAPGTRFLGKSVAKMLGIKPYLDREALESHLTTANCPSILLIATHGYFSDGKGQQDYLNLVNALLSCPDGKELEILRNNASLVDEDLAVFMKQLAAFYEKNGNQDVANWLRNFAAQIPEIAAALAQPRDNRLSTNVENPMLRSGLALAGANRWLSGGKLPKEAGKGFLFAQEVAGLDLWANELTVLSACQTGMGDIQLGEGVFGLRRAFAIAGTRTLIMSLWSVPDRVTALLMERMFADIKKGKGRGSALQSAQNYIRRITVGELRQSELGIEVLKELMGVVELKSDAELPWDDEVRLLEHPYYWGAWICQGETKPMVTGE